MIAKEISRQILRPVLGMGKRTGVCISEQAADEVSRRI